MFPVDQDLIKLCLVDHLRQLGCGEHFANETHVLMEQIYRYELFARVILRERQSSHRSWKSSACIYVKSEMVTNAQILLVSHPNTTCSYFLENR